MRSIALSALVAFAALAGGCGGSADSDGGGETGAAPAEAPSGEMKDAAMEADADASARKPQKRPRGKVVKVVDSDYGRVIADGKGEAFYLFDREKTKRSQCYGDCARAWPPVLTKGRPRAGKGAKARLLGTTKRRDGKLQVTYANQPLYYYVDDSPGVILCQNVAEFGGLWLVVEPNGKAVR